MEESGTMTLVDVLKICVEMLGEICIPAKYATQIAKPISNVIGNLNLCIEAENERIAQQKEGEEGEAGTDHATLE